MIRYTYVYNVHEYKCIIYFLSTSPDKKKTYFLYAHKYFIFQLVFFGFPNEDVEFRILILK